MRTLSLHLFAVTMLLLTACGSHKPGGRHSYYDRNGDGKVDLEEHVQSGVADADWMMEDNDHDGRYEKKVVFGFGVITSKIDVPLPTGVPGTE